MKHLGLISLLLLGFVACKKTATPDQPLVEDTSTISAWKQDVHGVRYNAATGSVVYNKADANGVFHIYSSNTDGSNELAIAYSGWPNDRHQWVEEIDPTGQFLICYVEKTDYVTETDHTRSQSDAIPGYGAYTDIWLLKRDGSQAWMLVQTANDYSDGVIHGALSPDGTKFAWSQRVKAPVSGSLSEGAGCYDFKVADISYGSSPALSNTQSFRPGNVMALGEVESISNDNSNFLFYSSYESNSIIATPVYRMNIASGAITKLTTESFAQCPTYTPDGSRILYMTGQDCDIFPLSVQGADWWIMNYDGSDKQRITWMNKKNSPQCQNAYRLAGVACFDTDSTFYGDIMTNPFGLSGYSVKVIIH